MGRYAKGVLRSQRRRRSLNVVNLRLQLHTRSKNAETEFSELKNFQNRFGI